MKTYEGFFVLPPDATADVRKTQMNVLETTIQKFGGKISQRHELGRKPLGYLLKKFREGYHVVIDFDMEPTQQQELRKTWELQEDLLKYMVTVKIPKPELPAPGKTPAPAATAIAAPSRAPRRAPVSSVAAPKTSEKSPVQ